ncbi:MAG: DUF488 family protein [Gammaproteobacteria bacterium]|nr:DUF488 family protein [Gammaproteobacteria bacterium]MCW5583432.1 DUF488 family protein [Gammaproteobacteria bacterium]
MTSNYRKAIHICRVYTPPARKLGMWILVDRLWPRGLKKEALAFDLWLKDITPSTALRQWFHKKSIERWREFAEQYIAELKNKGLLIEQVQKMAKHAPVTLFYAAKDAEHNHAIILREIICLWPKSPKIKSFL